MIADVRAKHADHVEFARRQHFPFDETGAWTSQLADRKVRYHRTAAEQESTLVTVRGGRLLRSDGSPVDTRDSSTFASGTGVEIFVTDASGEPHMASHEIGSTHHSSLLAGEAVGVAGEMQVTDGKIDWVSNKSGHYLPDGQPSCSSSGTCSRTASISASRSGSWTVRPWPGRPCSPGRKQWVATTTTSGSRRRASSKVSSCTAALMPHSSCFASTDGRSPHRASRGPMDSWSRRRTSAVPSRSNWTPGPRCSRDAG